MLWYTKVPNRSCVQPGVITARICGRKKFEDIASVQCKNRVFQAERNTYKSCVGSVLC